MKRPRELWIDAVRAIAVILVVLYHLLIWTHRDITFDQSGFGSFWDASRGVLTRLRMPILLAISGFLAGAAIQRGWGSVRLRLAANYWLYFVWLTLFFAFYSFVGLLEPAANLPVAVDTWPVFLQNIVMPSTALWFVVAMAVFPVVLWVGERSSVPTWLMIVGALAIWAVGVSFDMPQWIGKFARTFIFFAIGYYGRLVVPRIRARNWATALVALIAFALAARAFQRVIKGDLGALVVAVFAIVVAAVACPLIFKSGVHARIASFIGQRTLEIYVLHIPILSVVSLLLRGKPAVTHFTRTPVGDIVFTFGCVVVTVATALLVGLVLRRIPGVLALPVAWKRVLERD